MQKMEPNSTVAVVIAPVWSTQAWCASLLHLISGPCFLPSKSRGHSQPSTQTKISVPSGKDVLGFGRLSRKAPHHQGILREAENVIITSWRDSTKRQYNRYNQREILFRGQDRSPIKPTANDILAFLGFLTSKRVEIQCYSNFKICC